MVFTDTVNGEKREIHLMRAGGQRSQRRKWSHMIYSCDNIYGVIFLVALAEFNLCLEEDDSTSRMHESLLLFEQVLNDLLSSGFFSILVFSSFICPI